MNKRNGVTSLPCCFLELHNVASFTVYTFHQTFSQSDVYTAITYSPKDFTVSRNLTSFLPQVYNALVYTKPVDTLFFFSFFFWARSDWLLKLGIVFPVNLPALFWIS